MSGTGVIVLFAVIAVAIWWIDLRFHPIRRCPSCGGSKRNSSNPVRWGTCRRCKGKGQVTRWGAKPTKDPKE